MSDESKTTENLESESLQEGKAAESNDAAEKAAKYQEVESQDIDGQESQNTDEPETPEDIIQRLELEVATAKEDVLRAAAEAQNSRRRADQDVEKARKFALERFVSDLLPVVDNLERAMSAIDSEDDKSKSVLEGIELTYKSFIDTLSRYQVVVVDPVGEPFDPEVHQAMSMVPNPDAEPNTVIDVFQKGYVLNGRLVRPAMVVVSKAAE